jgi:hypothetical protein
MAISTTVSGTDTPVHIDRRNIEYRGPEDDSPGSYTNYSGQYFISAIYDQGGTFENSQNISEVDPNRPETYVPKRVIPFSSLLFWGSGIAATILLSTIGYIAIYKKKLTVSSPLGLQPVVRKSAITSLILLIVADIVLIFLFWYLLTTLWQ